MTIGRRRAIGITVGLIVVSVALVGLHRLTCGPSVHEHSRLVHVGMTVEQINAIWGRPVDEVDFENGSKAIYWDTYDGRISVSFEEGTARRSYAHPTNLVDQL